MRAWEEKDFIVPAFTMSQEGSGGQIPLWSVDLEKADSFRMEKYSGLEEMTQMISVAPWKTKQRRKTTTITNNKQGIRWWENNSPPAKETSSGQMIQSVSGPLQNMSELKKGL